VSERTVLITGASGSLGAEFAGYFLKKDWRVIATCKTDESLRKINSLYENERNSGQLYATCLDLLDERSVRDFVYKLKSSGKEPQYLVNNARSKTSLEVDDDGLTPNSSFVDEFHLGVISPYMLTMLLAQDDESKLKSVVNIASIYGVVSSNPALYEGLSPPLPIQYGVVKSALIHLTKELAVRLSPAVRVNAISYGGVEGRASEEFKERYGTFCPMGRMLKKSELVSSVEFLLDDGAGAVTGHNLMVDGGWSVW